MRVREDHSAGVIVFRREGRRLRFLLLRSRRTRRPLWEFPKGGIDEHESPRQAALRELQEETGLRPEQIRLIDGFQRVERYRFAVGRGVERFSVHKDVTYFLGETTEREITISTEEASDYVWLGTREALKRVRYKGRRELLRAAIQAAKDAAAGGPAAPEDAR